MPEKVYLPPEIEKYYDKWKKDPQSRVFAQLADAYRKNGMLDEAIEVCLEGLKVHPSYSSARMVLVRAYQEKGLDGEAGNELTEIIRNDPDNMLAHRMLADLSYKEGRLEEAIEQYHKVLSLTPLDREIRTILEKAEANLAEAPTPSESAETESDQGQEEGSRWEIPGSSFEMEGVELGAEEGKEPGTVPLGPTEKQEREDAFLTETIADLYLKQGLREKAVEIFSKMLDADPGNSHIQERLREAALPREEGLTPEGQMDLEVRTEGPAAVETVVPESPGMEQSPSLDLLEPEAVLTRPDEGVEEGVAQEPPGPAVDLGMLDEGPAVGSPPAEVVSIRPEEGTREGVTAEPPGLAVDLGMLELMDEGSPSVPEGKEPAQILSRWLEAIQKGRGSVDRPWNSGSD